MNLIAADSLVEGELQDLLREFLVELRHEESEAYFLSQVCAFIEQIFLVISQLALQRPLPDRSIVHELTFLFCSFLACVRLGDKSFAWIKLRCIPIHPSDFIFSYSSVELSSTCSRLWVYRYVPRLFHGFGWLLIVISFEGVS